MRKLLLATWIVGIFLAAAGSGLHAQEPKQPPANDPPEKKDPPKKKPAQDPVIDGKPLSVWVLDLKDPEPKNRQRAAESIAKLRGKAASITPDALAMLKDEKDDYTRQLGAYLLAWIKPDPKVVAAPLVEALKDKDGNVRRAASVALSTLGSSAKPQTAALLELLGDKEADTRQLAAFVLGNIKPDPQAVVNRLSAAAKQDESDLVRRSAGEALKKIDAVAAANAGIQ